MKKIGIIELNQLLKGSTVNYIGLKGQVLELQYYSDEYEINFYFDGDTMVSCTDEKINKIHSEMKEYDETASVLIYFIPVNLNPFKKFEYNNKDTFSFEFKNGYKINFLIDLENTYGNPLCISFRSYGFEGKIEKVFKIEF